MPTYTFFIISTSALSYNSGTAEFDFDAGYDSSVDRYRIDVVDDDNIMDGGGDANQTAMIYDLNGTLIDSGPITAPMYAEINIPGGGTEFLDRIEVDGVHYGYLPSAALTPGTSYSVADSDTDNVSHSYYESNSVPCFAADTMIATRDGEVPVQWVTPGCDVLTLDHGYQPVIWAGNWRVPWIISRASKRFWPVTLPGDPSAGERPLTVSAAHHKMLRDPWFELSCGCPEVLCRSGLIEPAMRPTSRQPLIWHHLLFANHEIISANGQWTESLFTGGAAFEGLPKEQQVQVLAAANASHTVTARHILRGYEAAAFFGHGARKANRADTHRRNKRVA